MGLWRVRRSARVIAAVLLLATARLPHPVADDPACVPTAIPAYGEHDESQHALQRDTPAESEHCALCHWARSLRSPLARLPLAREALFPPAMVWMPAETKARSAVPDLLPARAPPSALS